MGVCVVLHQAKQGGSWGRSLGTEREAVICCIIRLNRCTLRKHMLELGEVYTADMSENEHCKLYIERSYY